MIASRPRTPQEERDHVLEILDALDVNVEAFKKGTSAGWMNVSSQLFILLCDRNKHNRWTALVERVIPRFSLHPLLTDLSSKAGKYLFYLPRIRFDAEDLRLELLDLDASKIPLATWLTQVIVIGTVNDSGVPISIETLIKVTRDQAGGGHYDPNVGKGLQAAESFTFVEGGAHLPFFKKTLITIAEYVRDEVQTQM